MLERNPDWNSGKRNKVSTVHCNLRYTILSKTLRKQGRRAMGRTPLPSDFETKHGRAPRVKEVTLAVNLVEYFQENYTKVGG